eukprot:c26655_g1_i2 orf=535-2325(-)
MGSDKGPGVALALSALQALGCGFDVTTDFRIQFCKGTTPLVELDKKHDQYISLPGVIAIPNVSKDIKCDKGERVRLTSDVMQFQQMSELFNQSACIEGKIPLGYFNAAFDFSGSWQNDATQTKSLAIDGCFITLYKLQLTRTPLILHEEVKKAVPSMWEPAELARFILKYGTHIVVSVSIGGQDVLYLKERHSSPMSSRGIHSFLKKHGDNHFTEEINQKSTISKGNKIKEQPAPIHIVQLHSAQLLTGNKDITIIARRRGGNVSAATHNEWQGTVNSTPDVISMSFIPITSLLSGVPGKGFLNHAINLYLRYKPPVDEIRYFLEFQVPKQWAPVYSYLPLGPPQKHMASPSIRFRFMGPKLFVNIAQISVGRRPVTGLRLFLEGRKNNRLAIHVQHLASLPQVLETYWAEHMSIEPPRWHGSNDGDRKWFEPVQWKSFSHVCTKPVKYRPEWLDGKNGVFVVTGAQLEVRKFNFKKVLHLRLLFTKIPSCMITKSCWEQPASASERLGFFSALSSTFTQVNKKEKNLKPVVINSAVFPGGPPRPVQLPKLLKFVDTTELTKGPHDVPGHWLVTAAQLELDKGKICLRVKYSLLLY